MASHQGKASSEVLTPFPQGAWDVSVSVSLGCQDETPDKRCAFVLGLRVAVHDGDGGIAVECESTGHVASTVRKQEATNASAPCYQCQCSVYFLLSSHSRIPAPEWCLP